MAFRLRMVETGPVSGVCVVASLSPLLGLFSFHFLPTACAPSAGSGQAVGWILTPLRGSTPRRLSLPAIVRREGEPTSYW